VLLERAGLALAGPAWPGSTHSLADELLIPSVIYAPAVRAAMAAAPEAVHACAHVTGGGIAGNLARVLPVTCDAHLDRSRWSLPPIFTEIARHGDVADDEMARVFNLGLGMLVVVAAAATDAVLGALHRAGREASVVGQIKSGVGKVVLA
jgi:phosphoribosylformylglycinamidine cyclo-ligase